VAENTKTTENQKAFTIKELVELAKRGREDILPTLHVALDEHPELWQHYGSLAKQAQGAWLKLIAGPDLYMRECVERHTAHLMAALAGPEATALERLQAERIVALNLQTSYYEALLAQESGKASSKVTEYLHERSGVAEQRLQQAMLNLARVRKLLPRVLKVDVLVTGQIETTVKNAADPDTTTEDGGPTRVQVPANRIKDLLAAAAN